MDGNYDNPMAPPSSPEEGQPMPNAAFRRTPKPGELITNSENSSTHSLETIELDNEELALSPQGRGLIGDPDSRLSIGKSPSQRQVTKPASSNTASFRISCGQGLSSYKTNVLPYVEQRKHHVRQNLATRGDVKISSINKIKEFTNRPANSVPRNGLTTWKVLPTEVKIPDIRNRANGVIYYSRGPLGRKLIRNKPEFDLSDPYIHQKTLDTCEYSALHDPHCLNYFLQPSVFRHLRNQELVNDNKEVLCDVKEFNHYREYLGDMFADQVRRRVADDNAMKDLERTIRKDFLESQRQQGLAEKRRMNQRRANFNRLYTQAKHDKFVLKVQRWKTQLEVIDYVKAQYQVDTSETSAQRQWDAYVTRQKAAEQEMKKKRRTLTRIAFSETKNDYVTKYDKFVRMALMERFKADQAAVLIARDDQDENVEQLVEETLKRARNTWISRYDSYIERSRGDPLSEYHAKLLYDARVLFLMRKYWDMWVAYTHSRRKHRPDANHQSTFDKELKPFVADLKNAPSRGGLDSGDQKPKSRSMARRRSTVADIALLAARQKIEQIKHIKRHQRQDEPDLLHKGFGAASSSSMVPSKSKSVGKLKPVKPQVSGRSSVTDRKSVKAAPAKRRVPKVRQKLKLQEAEKKDSTDYVDKLIARYELEEHKLDERVRGRTSKRYLQNLDSAAARELANNITMGERQQEFINKITFIKAANSTARRSLLKLGWKHAKR